MNKKIKLQPNQEGTIDDLHISQSGIVTCLNNNNVLLKRRLLDMGITKGVVITVKKIAPLRDPVVIQLRGYELCLRRKDLKMIGMRVI